jgi:hypothetical protein
VTRTTTRSDSVSSTGSTSSTKRTRVVDEEEDIVLPKKLKAKSINVEMSIEEKIDLILNKVMSWEPIINQIPGMLNNLQSMSDNVQQLDTRVTTLETTQTAANDDIESIKSDLESARGEVNALKQNAICNDLVFYGLPPEVNSTNQFEVLQEIGEKLNVPMEKENFKKVFIRNNKTNTEKLIIATFTDNNHKERVKKQFKQRVEPIIVEDVVDIPEMSPFCGRQVYIVVKDQLTPENAKLLKEARKYKGTLFKHVWPSDGRILMKVSDDSRAHEVRTIADINKEVSRVQNT